MMPTFPGYDAWKLSCPYDDFPDIGQDEGEACNRRHPPDEDAPRGWTCTGTMIRDDDVLVPVVVCDTCGEAAR